ncbi:MAG: ABC transporter ATP-binding protein [Desulfobacteraceae bacterium]|jgi:peptide/nickel transport system ATP-binding protein/oligopeptide transport system ATP-binding protein
METLLSIEDLHVEFRGRRATARALEGVSYDVRPGETVCVVGESGCGKTVSALSILGILPVPPARITQGHIRFQDLELLDLDEEALQEVRGNRISMVFQEPMTSLNPVFTIGDQIREAIQVHKKVSDEEAMDRCVSLLHDVGIPSPRDRLRDYPHQLSGGQRQRVMIAMALSCGPELLIADEPTTALDVTIQVQILKLLQEIQQQKGLSLLYITHDLGVVAQIADRIFVMYAGVITEQGSARDIFHDPRHPYTKGLLASLPARARRGSPLYSVPGAVPDPAHKPDGCPFHPRCPIAEDSCRREFPELCDWGNGHVSRCPVLYNNPEKDA